MMERDTAPVRIRPATARDRSFILSLTPRLAAASHLAWRAPQQLYAFSQRGLHTAAEASTSGETGGCVLVAEAAETGALLGVAHFKEDSSVLTGEPQGYAAVLVVAAEAAGRGAGRALMTAGEAWARARGYRLLALDTIATNQHARAVYARLGYMEETLTLVKEL